MLSSATALVMRPGTPTLAWTIVFLITLVTWCVLVLGQPRRLSELYRHHFADARRERLFVASATFFVGIAATRLIAHIARPGAGPLGGVFLEGRHVHHLVWGILLLLAVGYLWLARVGLGPPESSRRASTLTALLYGLGAALALDEFALWYNLADVYWAREGRESIDALLLFGALLLLSLSGGPFLRALLRELARVSPRRGDSA